MLVYLLFNAVLEKVVQERHNYLKNSYYKFTWYYASGQYTYDMVVILIAAYLLYRRLLCKKLVKIMLKLNFENNMINWNTYNTLVLVLV